MPTESSVISDLIRGVNTRRLDDEPADDWLFQPVPRHRVVEPRAFEDAATAVRPQLARSSDPVIKRSPVLTPQTVVAKPIARPAARPVARPVAAAPVARPFLVEPVARPIAPSHRETWQQIFMMLFVGVLASIPFMYFELDGEDLVAALAIEAPQPAAPTVVMPVVAPAPAPAVTPIVEHVPVPATLPPPAETQPAPTAPPAPTVTVPARQAPKHRNVAKRVAAPQEPDPQPAAVAPTPALEPQAAKAESPKRPAVQSDDSENPLKRK